MIITITFLIIMLVIMIFVSLVDFIFPVLGAKRYGASKAGLWLSVLGMLVGVFFIPPWGIFIGAFVGALIGELLAGKRGKKALKAGWGVFVGNMVGIGLKLAYAGVVIFFYINYIKAIV